MIRIKVKLLLLELLALMLIIPFIPMEGLLYLQPTLSSLIWGTYSRVGFFFLVLLLLFIMHCKKAKIQKNSLLLIFFFLALAVNTYLKRKPLYPWIQYYFNSIIFILIYNIFQRQKPVFISVVSFYFSLLCFVNLLFVLFYPNGMYIDYSAGYYSNWLLGYKSSLQYYVLPSVILSWVDSKYSKSSSKFLFANIVSVVETLLCGNYMLFVVLFVFDVFVFFKFYELPFFNIKTYTILAFAINFVLVFYVNFVFNSSLGTIIQKLFNKTSTLSSRTTIIWPKAISFIIQSPIFGHGVMSSSEYRALFVINSATHAHNQILNYFIEGGTVYVLLFVLYLMYLFRKSNKKKCKLFSCFSLGLFLILLCFSIEVITRHIGGGLWLLFVMFADSEEIEKQFLSKNEIINKKRSL